MTAYGLVGSSGSSLMSRQSLWSLVRARIGVGIIVSLMVCGVGEYRTFVLYGGVGKLFAAEGAREANFFAGGPLRYKPLPLTYNKTRLSLTPATCELTFIQT